ncbi:hypothetical protein ACIZ62_15655 [Acetobacterium carbinolicum]|uniref:hypothetical protein n=1 Tax=Acetobacterium carbinolicum TaxID=52690 RepID=UPI0039BF84A5
MWYVINIQNGKKLRLFRDRLIIPLFEHMIAYKHEEIAIPFDKYLDEIIKTSTSQLKNVSKHAELFKLTSLIQRKETLENDIKVATLLVYIYKRANNNVSFSSNVTQLLSKYSENEIRKHLYTYYYQNNALKSRKAFIDVQNVPDEWRVVFKNFYYEKFFNMPQVWERLDGTEYTREKFHDNFKEDNNIYVCPYCDATDVSDNGNLEIEHFWPESIYPFLAMSPLNLYSTCKSCNRPSTGKGIRTINPMTMPFYELIGNEVIFKPDIINRKIHIHGKTLASENFIKLIKLEERYSKKGPYHVVEILSSTIYDTIKQAESHGAVITDEDIAGYVSNKIIPKVQPHYFVTTDILKGYNKYLDFLDK